MSEKICEKDALVWIDCEMTGLDVEHDDLIEVAVIVTDRELNPLDKGIDVLIPASEQALAGMDDFVRNMHTSSGLLDELSQCSTTMEEAEQQVLDYISQFTEPRKALLAGNSIGTDKMFLARYMPKVIDYLHYRVIDVSSIKELARRWYPRSYYQAPQKNGGHRALADIQESLIELYYYRQVLFPEGEGPTTAECQQKARIAKKWFHTNAE